MAHELNISQAAYTKIEKNETKLTVDRLFQIAKILETPASELIGAETNTVYNQNNSYNAIDYQQQVVNLYQENKETTPDFIHSLKQEIQHVMEENLKLFDILGKK